MKHFTLFLAALLIWNSTIFADPTLASRKSPQTQPQKDPQTLKVEPAVRKRGIGEKSRVRVTQTNGSQVMGYISKIEEFSFAVTNKKTGQTTTIAYAEVQKIQGPGLSKGDKIALGVVAGVVVGLAVWGITVVQYLKKQ